jgi:hypothetical protein
MFVWLRKAFTIERATALVALAASATALYFTYYPDRRPFVPTDLRAHTRVEAIERGVTLDQWRWRVTVGNTAEHAKLVNDDPATKLFHDRCGLGTQAGYLLYVDTDAKGFKKHSLSIRAALYDLHSRHRIAIAEKYAQLARVPIDAPTAESVSEIWLWDPGKAGPLFARVELYAPSDQLIGIADSKPFKALSERELEGLPSACIPPP